jgi:hypothetical protein
MLHAQRLTSRAGSERTGSILQMSKCMYLISSGRAQEVGPAAATGRQLRQLPRCEALLRRLPVGEQAVLRAGERR